MSLPEEVPEVGSDQLTFYREKCAEKEHIVKLHEVLEECNNRVNSRTNTMETCQQEMLDYLYELDHCAMPKAFAKLK